MAQPLKVFKSESSKGISIAVFENAKGYALTISKRYLMKGKGYVDTKNYWPNEIEPLVGILVEAHAYVMSLPEKENTREAPLITDMVPMPDIETKPFDDDDIIPY